MKEDQLQKVLSMDLFSSSPSVDGLKQVLQFMEPHAQPLSAGQLKAIAYLNWLGMRDLHKKYRDDHKGKHPYTDLVKWIIESAINHADPGVFLRTIEAVIPPQGAAVPPPQGNGDGQRRRRR